MKKLFALLATVLCFVFSNAQPTITSFSPMYGSVGTIDTIYGTHFSATTANNIVYFGATRAKVNYADTSKLIVTIPSGARHDFITVTIAGLTAYSSKPFIPTFGTGSDSVFFTSSFAPGIDYPITYKGCKPSIYDMDGDGKPDIILASNSSILVMLNTSSNGNISFGQRAEIFCQTNVTPGYVAIGDLNGDGKPDIVYSNSNWILSVIQNTSSKGNLSFSLAMGIDQNVYGTQVNNVAIRDLDGDGRPEVLCNLTSYTKIYRNLSSLSQISFSSGVNLNAYYPYGGFVFSFDINGDNKPEIITPYKVYLNNSTKGNIQFDSIVSPYGLFYNDPIITNAKTADFDNDGRMDLIKIWDSYYPGMISVYRNMSNSSNVKFDRYTFNVSFGQCWGIDVFDMDGDGKPDLIISGMNYFAVYKNTSDTGNINFSLYNYYASTAYPYSQNNIVVGDISGDGKPDVVLTTTPNPDRVSVFKFIDINIPSITSFSPESGPAGIIDTIFGKNFNPVDTCNIVYYGQVKANVVSATTNMIIVLVPPGASNDNISVFTGERTAFSLKPFRLILTKQNLPIDSNSFVFQSSYLSQPGEKTGIKDLDGDGNPDISLKNYVLRDSLTNDSIRFATLYSLPTQNHSNILPVFDLNNDGKPDILSLGQAPTGSNKGLSCNANHCSPGNMVFSVDYPGGFLIDSIDVLSEDVAYGDFDGDGKIDLVSKRIDGPLDGMGVAVSRNNGSRQMASCDPPIRIIGHNLGRVFVEDMDGDSKPDIVAFNLDDAYSTHGTFWIYKNTTANWGKIIFAFPQSFDIYNIGYPDDIAISDINGDGKKDVIISGYNSVSVFKNTSTSGNINFDSEKTFFIGFSNGGRSWLTISDLNGDGRPDILMSCKNYLYQDGQRDTLAVLRNTSVNDTIRFTLTRKAKWANNVYGQVAGDFNRDGKPDLALTVVDTIINPRTSIFKNNIKFPVLKSISPDNATNGQILSVTIRGSLTQFSKGKISASLYNGLSFMKLNSVSVINDSTISATLIISNGNKGGYYTLLVTDSIDGNLSLIDCFQLVGTSVTQKLISTAPNSGIRKQQLLMNIYATGTHFMQDTASVKILFVNSGIISSDIKLTTKTVVNDTLINCTVNIDSTARGGWYMLKVYDYIDDTMTLSNALKIFMPSLVNVTPSWGNKSQTININIAGSQTHFTQISTSKNIGFYLSGILNNAIVVNSFTINNDTSLTCSIAIDSVATSGLYELRISDSIDGTLSLNNAFNLVNSGINEVSRNHFFIHPNPVKEELLITTSDNQLTTTNFKVIDLLGRVVKEENLPEHRKVNSISVSELVPGVYFLSIQNENGTDRLKFVKE